MIKTYKASTAISINVVLPSKKNLLISFIPLSNGCSTFTTDSEDIMRAVESHYNYGKLFRLIGTTEEKKDLKKSTNSEENPEGNQTGVTIESEAEKGNMKKVSVSDYGNARDYLADTFGISRRDMRSMKAVTEQAAAHGIEFLGLS